MTGRRITTWIAVVVVALLGGACGGTRGMKVVPQTTVAPPAPDEAVIVFMRPALVGEVYSTSVFELGPDGDRFVGIVRGQTRLAHRLKPGRTRFMLVTTGGADDYMDADIVGGKTYYVIIAFASKNNGYVLRPVRVADQEAQDFKACLSTCTWVENTERSEAWGRNHLRELPRRKAQTLAAWEAQRSRASLRAGDGR